MKMCLPALQRRRQLLTNPESKHSFLTCTEPRERL